MEIKVLYKIHGTLPISEYAVIYHTRLVWLILGMYKPVKYPNPKKKISFIDVLLFPIMWCNNSAWITK